MQATSALRERFGHFLRDLDAGREVAIPPLLTGLESVDALTGGLPRGAMTEIFGPRSSGRTSLMYSILASAGRGQEYCALVDASDTFDPLTAESAGVPLGQLLWVRCGKEPENALKATDLLIQGGGFGVVMLDLGEVPEALLRRFPLPVWYRLRRAVETTPTVLAVLETGPRIKPCTSLAIEMSRAGARWPGAHPDFRLLRGMEWDVAVRKPARRQQARGEARFPLAG